MSISLPKTMKARSLSLPNFPAKCKLSQIKAAQSSLQRRFSKEIADFSLLQQSFQAKTAYFSRKEAALLHELQETQRMFELQSARKYNPVWQLLAESQRRAAFFAKLYEFQEDLSRLLLNSQEFRGFAEWFRRLSQQKISSFHEFLHEKTRNHENREQIAMMREEMSRRRLMDSEFVEILQGNSGNQRNLLEKQEKPTSFLENIEKRGSFLEKSVNSLEKQASFVELDTSLEDFANNLREFLQIVEKEHGDGLKDLENSIKNCLTTTENVQIFTSLLENVVNFKSFLEESCEFLEKSLENRIKQQKSLRNSILKFPDCESREIYELICEGSKKNKHFRENFSAFCEFFGDLFAQIQENYQETQEKREKLNKNRLKSSKNSDFIKLKDLFTVKSRDFLEITAKKARNLEFVDEISREIASFSPNSHQITEKTAQLYDILTEERLFVEFLQEKGVKALIFDDFYVDLLGNYRLLDNFEANEAENIDFSDFSLFEAKIQAIKEELHRVRAENAKEICEINGEILKKQLELQENKEKIQVLDRYSRNFKLENNLKTTQNSQNTQNTQNSKVSDNSFDENSRNLGKNPAKPGKRRQSCSFFTANCRNVASFAAENREITRKSKKIPKKSAIYKENTDIFNRVPAKALDLPLQMGCKQRNSREIQEKLAISGLSVQKVAKESVNSSRKPRILKLLRESLRVELWKTYFLAGKEKKTLENAFFAKEIKEIDAKAFVKPGNLAKKEVLFRIIVENLGELAFFVENYEEAKVFKALLRNFVEISAEKQQKKQNASVFQENRGLQTKKIR